MKWKYAGKRVKTAEDFIRCCASVSSISGSKYRIRFADGRTVDSEVYFASSCACSKQHEASCCSTRSAR